MVLCKLQIRFVLLQARMLRRIYGRTHESNLMVHQKTVAKTEGKHTRSYSHRAPLTLIDEASQKEPSHKPQTTELPPAASVAPKVVSTAETSVWQTKTLKARKTAGGRPYAVKQVDVLAPPGFGSQTHASGVVTKTSAHDAPSEASHDSMNRSPVSPLSDGHPITSEAAYQTVPVMQLSIARPSVKLPPGLFDSNVDIMHSANAQPRVVSDHSEKHPSGHDNDRLAGAGAGSLGKIAKRSTIKKVEPAGAGAGSLGNIARRSAIKKVEPAQWQGNVSYLLKHCVTDMSADAGTNKDAKLDRAKDTTSNFGLRTTATIYDSIKPATLGELRHKFIDTSPLKKAPGNEHRQFQPVEVTPLSPEEAAHEALVIAFNERESSRIQLNSHYSLDGALDFDEKARTYNSRRQELAAIMPSGQLSGDDVWTFPFLSTKDTVEPQVCESTFHLL